MYIYIFFLHRYDLIGMYSFNKYVCIYNQSYENKYENKKSQFCFLFDSLHEQKIKVISVCGAFLTMLPSR